MKKKLTVLFLTVALLVSAGACTLFASAAVAEGSGWTQIGTTGDYYILSDSGDLTGARVAGTAHTGSNGAPTANNMLVQSDALTAEEDYIVEATFTPTGDRNVQGQSRIYGIVPWYVDENNYFVFYIEQKSSDYWAPDVFSAQPYGMINGSLREFAVTSDGAWSSDEWYDLWWDNSTYMPENVLAQKNILLTETLTLKAVVTNDAHLGETCKKFELHIIGTRQEEGETVPDDKLALTVWVRNTAAQAPKTGVYVSNFDLDISYARQADSDVSAFEQMIAALPDVTAEDFAEKVVAAYNKYLQLGDRQSEVSEETKQAYEKAVEDLIGLAESRIAALDGSSASLTDDVVAVRLFINGLPREIQGEIANISALEGYEEAILKDVEEVEAMIEALPNPVALSDEQAVAAARAAYDGLYPSLQTLVSADTYTLLTAAESRLAMLKNVAAAEELIAAIGTVTADSEAAIDAAREAYNALGDGEKQLVSAEAKEALSAAERAYNKILLDAASPHVPAGWTLETDYRNAGSFVFENGTLSKINAVGATSAYAYNFALKTEQVGADADFSIMATFDPSDAANTGGAERTYGLVPWFVDKDNYLIFWMCQKSDGSFSANFYGRVNGQFRSYIVNDGTQWSSGEFYDLWWDNSSAMPPSLLRQSNAVIQKTILLQVRVSNVTYAEESCKKFEVGIGTTLQDIVFTAFYVRGMGNEAFLTGLYADNFNITVRDIAFAEKSELDALEEAIAAIPESRMSENYIPSVLAAYELYEKLGVGADLAPSSARLVSAFDTVAVVVDGQIASISSSSATFAADVAAARALYDSLPEIIRGKIEKASVLAALESQIENAEAANAVKAKIDAIPATVTLADEQTVADARNAYDALNLAQKDLISAADSAKLANAETMLASLKAVSDVAALIDAIPETVTEEDGETVATARAAYDALSDSQKSQLSTDRIKKLTDAEAALSDSGEGESKGCKASAFGGAFSVGGVSIVLSCGAILCKKKKERIN